MNNTKKNKYYIFLRSLPKKINHLYFGRLNKKFKINNKSKKGKRFDPVTNIDRSIELYLRNEISKKFPKDGIVGEEFKSKKSLSGFTWIIDPIDGTKSFIIGGPTWSNLIAVYYNNAPTFGLINFPILNKYYLAGIKKASYKFKNNKLTKLKTLNTNSGNNLKIAGNFFGWLPLKDQKKISKLTKLMNYPCLDALSYCQLCDGTVDAVLQCSNKIWDIAPMIPLIKNVGGCISTWDGKDPRNGGNIIASSNKRVHKKILNLLKPIL